MKQNIIHIGLDVDDAQIRGAVFNKETGFLQFPAATEPARPIKQGL